MDCKPLLNCYFSQFSSKSHICSCKKLYFQFLSPGADILSLCGHGSIFEFLKMPKIAWRIDKFHAKSAIHYLNTCKRKFLSEQSIFMTFLG